VKENEKPQVRKLSLASNPVYIPDFGSRQARVHDYIYWLVLPLKI
jgi:hypothetical protein